MLLTGPPHGDAEVALWGAGEEVVGGRWGGGRLGRGSEEAADAGGDDARVHTEEGRVEGDDAEEPMASAANIVANEGDLSGEEAAHGVAQQHDIGGVTFKRGQPAGQSDGVVCSHGRRGGGGEAWHHCEKAATAAMR